MEVSFRILWSLQLSIASDIMGAIAAYWFFPKKPSIKNDIQESDLKIMEAFKQQLLLAA